MVIVRVKRAKRETTVPSMAVMDQKWFKDLFEGYYSAIVRQLTYLTGERAVAEELAQETFFKLYSTPPQDLANPGAWLAKVAINLGYNYLRGEKRRKNREEYVGVREFPNLIAIDDIGIRNQEIRMVRQVLKALPGRDRMLLLLKFSGYRYEEIASVIGVEKTSVGTLLARAQTRFREEYIRRNGGKPDVDG